MSGRWYNLSLDFVGSRVRSKYSALFGLGVILFSVNKILSFAITSDRL
jgi:hypothetical protein